MEQCGAVENGRPTRSKDTHPSGSSRSSTPRPAAAPPPLPPPLPPAAGAAADCALLSDCWHEDNAVSWNVARYNARAMKARSALAVGEAAWHRVARRGRW